MTEADTLPDLSNWKPRGKRTTQAERLALAAHGLKWCAACRTVKALDAFASDRSRPDGLNLQCKACDSEESRRWRAANPEYYLSRDKARHADTMKTARRLKKAAVYFQHRTEYLKPLAAYALRHPRATQMLFTAHTLDALCAWYVDDITLPELQKELCS